jgi:hypothetical protein
MVLTDFVDLKKKKKKEEGRIIAEANFSLLYHHFSLFLTSLMEKKMNLTKIPQIQSKVRLRLQS